MKKSVRSLMLAAFMVLAVSTVHAETTPIAEEVIQSSDQLVSNEAKLDFLLEKAQAYLDQDQSQDAQQVVEYILSKVDETSTEAQEILTQLTQEQKEVE